MISSADARRVIAASEKKEAEIGQPMNIAVADGGGNLVAHVRMDGAWTRFGIHASNDGKILIFAGGVPFKKDGKVVGRSA